MVSIQRCDTNVGRNAPATANSKTRVLASLAFAWCLVYAALVIPFAESFQLPSNGNTYTNAHMRPPLSQGRSSPLYSKRNSESEKESKNKNKTSIDKNYFDYVYPECVTSRGKTNEPTEAWVNTLVQTILPAIKFFSTAKPLKVPGGYAITGSHKFKDGDKLIEAIDAEIAKSQPTLKDQMTVLYTPRYGPLNMDVGKDMQPTSNKEIAHLMADAGNEPFLYITGPTIVENSNPVITALVSISGLVVSWYLVDDMSVPLFVCFIGLQLAHEGAHVLTASSKGVKLSFPVFVPISAHGITNTVTTFKTLPKNKNDMFDIAAAGPLAGIVVSLLALAIGAKLTLMSNPATLPALPLDILRQSMLGGAIIDNIFEGSLYLPSGMPTAGMTIPLHPIGVAGYFGLIVNALALLPIGTTDGGRMLMTLFDRQKREAIEEVVVLALLFAGLSGSHFFWYYYGFCCVFQSGNDVPARNEQDPVDSSRILVALVGYALAILTLFPFK